MTMNYKEVSAGLRKDPRYAKIAGLMDALVTSFEKKGLLPDRIADPYAEILPVAVSESYRQAKKALAEKGYFNLVFSGLVSESQLLRIQELKELVRSDRSLAVLRVKSKEPDDQNKERFVDIVGLEIDPESSQESPDFGREHSGHINISKVHSGFALYIEIAVNPNELILPGSFNLSQEQQIAMIQKHEEELKKDSRLKGVKIEMSTVTVYKAINTAYREKHGKKLFRDFGKTVTDITDDGSGVSVASRDRPEFRVSTEGNGGEDFIWRAKFTDDPRGWAVPVIVLPKKLAA